MTLCIKERVILRTNLVNFRKRKQLTQEAAASAVRLKLRQYQRLEEGSTNGSIPVWESLRTLLDAPSIDYLLQDDRPAS